jgi:hypothetical protein
VVELKTSLTEIDGRLVEVQIELAKLFREQRSLLLSKGILLATLQDLEAENE